MPVIGPGRRVKSEKDLQASPGSDSFNAAAIKVLDYPSRETQRGAIINHLKTENMKDFFKTIENDYKSENFTLKEWIIGAVVGPLALLAIMGLAGWLETACV